MAKQKNPWLKYIIILGVVLILLLIANLKDKKYEQKITDILDLNSEDITSFTITQDTLSVTLVKGDSLWYFEAPDTGKVSDYKIENFFKSVVNGKKSGFATKNPDKYNQYNVGDISSTTIELKNGGIVLAEIIVGQSQNWTESYFRFPDDPKVYISTSNITRAANPRASSWR